MYELISEVMRIDDAVLGMLQAVDRLPLIPGALELVGIGYTGVTLSSLLNLLILVIRAYLFWQFRIHD